MPDLDGQLQRWIDAHIIDAATAERIRQFELDAGQTRRRWPAVLAVSFGALMLCAGVLLFVAAHWDELSPALRFTLVLAMVAVFHLAAGILGRKVEIVGVALHFAGTAALGAAIFLSAQIFNLEEHRPSGLLLWGIGAVAGWFVLRQWPQALAAAILVPWWLVGEWDLAAHDRPGSGSIVPEGLLLLAILYMTVVPRERNRALRLGLVWLGSISLLPCILFVVVSGEHLRWRWHDQTAIPIYLMVLGYAGAYLPVLAFAAITRKMASLGVFAAAACVLVLSALSQTENTDSK